MPPKKKIAEPREEHEFDREITGPIESSPGSSASSLSDRSSLSTSTCASLTSDQLEQILANNQKAMLEASHQSMTKLLATLSPSAGTSSAAARVPLIKVPKWTDDEIPSEYFNKLEKALKHNGVDQAAWGQLLPIYMSGKAQAAFAQVDVSSLDNYEAVKATLLESLGDTPASADRKWWTLSRLPGEEAGSFYLRVRAVGIRRLHGLASREEIVEKMILSRFLSLLSSDSYSSVVSRHPKDGLEAARLVQELEETRSFTRRRQPWKQDASHYHPQSHSRREQGSSSNGGGNTSPVGVSSGLSGRESSGSQNAGNTQSNGSKTVKGDRQARKPIICHGCGEPGHIRPNCPNKVRRVRSPDCDNLMEVEGWLAGSTVNGLRVDTGADRSIVCADFVPKNAYLKRTVVLDSWRGKQLSKHKLARIKIKVGETEVDTEIAVAEQLDCPALLGNDLGPKMTVQLLGMIFEAAKANQADIVSNVVTKQESVSEKVAPVRSTRAQQEREKLEEIENDVASAQSESNPVALSDIFGFEDEFYEDDPLPTPVDSCEVLPEVGVVDVPLPCLVEPDTDSLIKEQQDDVSLKVACKLANKLEKGYSFMDGVLVHTTSDGLGDSLVRILVPTKRRLGVLEMAHTHMLAGHFGVKGAVAYRNNFFFKPA